MSGDLVPAVELREVWFKYERGMPDVIRGLSVKVQKGEFLAIVGGNGTGKTTALSLISGISTPQRGKVLLEGEECRAVRGGSASGLLGMLPQNPQALFVKKTVREDLLEILYKDSCSKDVKENRLSRVSKLCRLGELMNRHPYDLSGGEQQRAALAKVLLLEPKILLLDEPTKGLDAAFKRVFAKILEELLHQGVTIVMVSHDIEFCASYAHRCAMFFDGQIVTDDTPRTLFSGNSFYTTSANRMARHHLPEAITAEDVIAACGGETPPLADLAEEAEDEGQVQPIYDVEHTKSAKGKLPLWRRLMAWAAGITVLITAYLSLAEPDIPWLMKHQPMGLYLVLIVSVLALALAFSPKGDRPIEHAQVPLQKGKLPKRTVLATVMILIAIPITIYIGIVYFGDRKYYFISLLILLEGMLPFLLIFEGRKPQARELIIISVLCALGVAGRAAFFMLPEFKPIAAMVIIAAVAFGGEAGFLVGSVTMLVSNIMFGQGPWTPWQMFAMGMIGYLAGVLFQKGALRRRRLPLCVFGGLATLLIYGGLMNPAAVMMYYDHPTWQMFLSAYLLGFPFDLVHAFATVTFLWFIAQPMLEKLDRIKVKYGLMESL